MAMILCDKPGKQPCIFASQHFVNAVHDKEELKEKLYVLVLNLPIGVGYHWVDEDFLLENKILIYEDIGKVIINDEEQAFEIFAKLVPVCRECYIKFLQRNNLCRPHQVE